MQLKEARVLVVDDELALLEIFKRWFEREGCRVFTAQDGAQALDLASANAVDMVVSDIRMPVLDGIELAKRLKKRSGHAPKMIFISGFSDVSEREGFDLGVEAMLHKPIERADLVAAARRSLMDRDELWRQPPAVAPTAVLDARFPSLSAARQQGLIAFGRGGFCLRSNRFLQVGKPVGLRLEFEADRHALIGQGVVRWMERRDEQIGIEIAYVDDAQRAWFAQLAESDESASFIPRTSIPATGPSSAA